MDKHIAEDLATSLQNHFFYFPVDTEATIDTLARTEVSGSHFHHTIPENSQTTDIDNDQYHVLRLRRVLSNTYTYHNIAGWKQVWSSLVASVGGFSSTHLARTVRSDQQLVALLQASTGPFSLLGKLESYDLADPDRLFVTTTPLLIVPGYEKDVNISKWEREHSTSEEEKRTFLFFPYRTRA